MAIAMMIYKNIFFSKDEINSWKNNLSNRIHILMFVVCNKIMFLCILNQFKCAYLGARIREFYKYIECKEQTRALFDFFQMKNKSSHIFQGSKVLF